MKIFDKPIARRSILASALATPVVLAANKMFAADSSVEADALNALYKAAKSEGGTLIVYAGGDTSQQQDATDACRYLDP
jgi:hypothetical protein